VPSGESTSGAIKFITRSSLVASKDKTLQDTHTEQGKAVFDLMDESNGTRNLFLRGPVLDILSKG
jgi:hypothetical protein